MVVGADGRNSVVRQRGGLVVEDVGAPQDVLWMRVSKHAGDPEFLIHADRSKTVVLLDRGTHWQCGLTVPKGASEKMRTHGIDALRASILENAPFLSDRMQEVRDWNDVKLLTVRVDRLRQWHRPGLLCIGDAAHAMAPIGGVGINLAIQDAVAAANLLAGPLHEGTVTNEPSRDGAAPPRVPNPCHTAHPGGAAKADGRYGKAALAHASNGTDNAAVSNAHAIRRSGYSSDRPPTPLESSQPGVFIIGDARMDPSSGLRQLLARAPWRSNWFIDISPDTLCHKNTLVACHSWART